MDAAQKDKGTALGVHACAGFAELGADAETEAILSRTVQQLQELMREGGESSQRSLCVWDLRRLHSCGYLSADPWDPVAPQRNALTPRNPPPRLQAGQSHARPHARARWTRCWRACSVRG